MNQKEILENYWRICAFVHIVAIWLTEVDENIVMSLWYTILQFSVHSVWFPSPPLYLLCSIAFVFLRSRPILF